MASASKQYRLRVGMRGHTERHWVEHAGLSPAGEIETRFARWPSPSGLFSRKDAEALRKRLRKWWAIVRLDPVI